MVRSTERTDGRGDLDDWASIDWPAVERNVRRLQERIFRASQNGETATVRNLQQLLVRSSAAKLLAIRQVTQINCGRNTLVHRWCRPGRVPRGTSMMLADA
jgi:RNA-directed DNA polymerase